MSLILTCELNGVGSLDYLIASQKHARHVAEQPPGCPGTIAMPWPEPPRYDEGDPAEKESACKGQGAA